MDIGGGGGNWEKSQKNNEKKFWVGKFDLNNEKEGVKELPEGSVAVELHIQTHEKKGSDREDGLS